MLWSVGKMCKIGQYLNKMLSLEKMHQQAGNEFLCIKTKQNKNTNYTEPKTK